MYHSLFIYSSTERHLGCFQVWAMINKAVSMHRFLGGCKLSPTLGKYQGAQLLDCTVKVSLASKKLPSCLPKWLCQFAFRPARNEGSCCSTSLPEFDVIRFLDFDHSNKCVVISHCWFNLHFPSDVWCGMSFHMLICTCVSSLVRCLLRSLTHFKIRLLAFLLLNFKCSLYILDSSPLSDVSFANIFSQSVSCLLIPLLPLLFVSKTNLKKKR